MTYAFKSPAEKAIDAKTAKALRDKSKILSKIFKKFRSTEDALLKEFFDKLSCENCGSINLSELQLLGRCPDHGVVSQVGRKGEHFCPKCGQKLEFERQHNVSIDGVYTVTFILMCEDCEMRFQRTRRFGLPGEPLVAKLQTWYKRTGL